MKKRVFVLGYDKSSKPYIPIRRIVNKRKLGCSTNELLIISSPNIVAEAFPKSEKNGINELTTNVASAY